MRRPKIFSKLAAVTLIGGCTQPPAAAVAPSIATPKQEAAAALQRQDYVTAERLYRSLAEQGDASAQLFLGKMYQNGDGVRRDFVEAAKWFRLAAEQGHTGAQFYLGRMYADGQGMPRDYVQAYMWLDLSSEGSQEFFAAADRSTVAAKMTPAQIKEAQRLASEWQATRSNRR